MAESPSRLSTAPAPGSLESEAFWGGAQGGLLVCGVFGFGTARTGVRALRVSRHVRCRQAGDHIWSPLQGGRR